MTPASESPVLVQGLVKDYQSLRPLRVRALTIAPGAVVAISGIDAPAAEVLVHLITGAMLPDAGDVSLFGHNTRAIPDGDRWLASLDRVGILSTRAVLIDVFTVLQNIAMPFTLDVDPIDPRVGPLAGAVALEAGLDAAMWDQPVARVSAEARMRAHFARALALDPQLLIAEHPSATLPRGAVRQFAADMGRVARARGLALVALTADESFARALGGQRLHLDGASGELRSPSLLQRLRG